MSTERVSVPWKTHGFVWAVGSSVFTALWWTILLDWTTSIGSGFVFLLIGGGVNTLVLGFFLFYLVADLINTAANDVPPE